MTLQGLNDAKHWRDRAVPFYSDGKFGPAIKLRELFQHFLNETS